MQIFCRRAINSSATRAGGNALAATVCLQTFQQSPSPISFGNRNFRIGGIKKYLSAAFRYYRCQRRPSLGAAGDHSALTCQGQQPLKPQRGRSTLRKQMPYNVGGPAPTHARQGREQQKYGADGARLVAGCIPVRFISDEPGPSSVRILMISSRNGKGYAFPKGGWEEDESVEMAALRETVEEAGVRGVLEMPLLGTFAFQSGKPEKQGSTKKGHCLAYMFAMNVYEELETWPEAEERHRFWCTLEEAYSKARYDWMRDALQVWAKRKGWVVSVVPESSVDSITEISRIVPPSPETPIASQV